MKLIAPLVLLFVVICNSCSKKPDSLTGMERLLVLKPWKLQSSDTIRYDSAYHITGHPSANLSDCRNELYYYFYGDHTFSAYLGCSPPQNPQSSDTWDLSNDFLDLYADSSPRSGPIYIGVDSVELLTKDSLILSQRVIPYEPSSAGFLSSVPLLVHSSFSH